MKNKLITQTVYVPIDAGNHSPKKLQDYFVTIDGNKAVGTYIGHNFWSDNSVSRPTEWLQKKEDQIVLSKDELRAIIAEAQGFSFAVGLENCSIDRSKKLSDIYIDNLLNEKV